jgi:hypothetical protein
MNKLHELQSCISLHIQCNSLQLNYKFYQHNSFSTIMQLHYDYTHDVILMSFIVIHLLKFDTWHYEFFWIYIFFEILISNVHYDW